MNTESTELAKPLTSIAEYSRTAAALADLEARYKGTLFDVTTKAGLADAIKSRAELRTYRVELEKTRVAIKAPALKRAKEIDSEANRIREALEALENPIDKQINAERDRKEAEAKAKADAEAARIATEEAARKAAEEAVLKTQREEIARQQAELLAKQKAAEAEQAEARRKIEQEQREAREKIEAEQRAARLEREEADRKAAEARERLRGYTEQIQGIQQQVIIAHSGRLGVRVGGTIACIEATLAETEAWVIDAENFGPMVGAAQKAKDAAVSEIREMLRTAVARAAEETAAAARRAAAEAEQAAEAQRVREAQEKVDAERRAVEDAARKEREAQEERERQARLAAEKIERDKQAEEDARQKAERDAREAADRASIHAATQLLDGRALLARFLGNYGELPEFVAIGKVIDEFLNPASKSQAKRVAAQKAPA